MRSAEYSRQGKALDFVGAKVWNFIQDRNLARHSTRFVEEMMGDKEKLRIIQERRLKNDATDEKKKRIVVRKLQTQAEYDSEYGKKDLVYYLIVAVCVVIFAIFVFCGRK